MKKQNDFENFFHAGIMDHLEALIRLALQEDGQDLTSMAVFSPEDKCLAVIKARQKTLVAGLPLVQIILNKIAGESRPEFMVQEGDLVDPNTPVVNIRGGTCKILRAERIILNFMARLSGIANLTRAYIQKIQDTDVKLLDTRKTTPGHRYLEKYAVRLGGGMNHRMDLEEMLMLKDNHIDQAGSIEKAVQILRNTYQPCPPVEVECRSVDDVREAVRAGSDRIMLDNMGMDEIRFSLKITRQAGVESEISGGVNLDNIRDLALLGPTYISVGALTHSAVAADFSMNMEI
ncbi:nicotinate-nucleotide pyrophosphorylase [Desulfonatronospira thiodismutans ASO3-1]|uniref:nicotinate-nucleotide diphosphorylase (carboxylating) n=1 Tax=Desulfonatronospira thiodismutans ASO3-1 TaxID=555779 RepID=D6SK78_9BACT|nr:carboxylating nicotinate-nucleotide diphosphorylase [Desulfonatronospira thiodismutans]EFI36281.1 nicotinate-nucleotide pyrophosphorylase [Desulfonatronospira thiodismutans ASO3-1]